MQRFEVICVCDHEDCVSVWVNKELVFDRVVKLKYADILECINNKIDFTLKYTVMIRSYLAHATTHQISESQEIWRDLFKCYGPKEAMWERKYIS